MLCRQCRSFLDCFADNFLALLEGRIRNNFLFGLLLAKREELGNTVINNSRDQSDHWLVRFMIQRKSGKIVRSYDYRLQKSGLQLFWRTAKQCLLGCCHRDVGSMKDG